MKSCNCCKYADWYRTQNGRLHSSGDGKCTYPYKVPVLPASMHWTWRVDPTPSGGFINRREELKEHCAYFAREEVVS